MDVTGVRAREHPPSLHSRAHEPGAHGPVGPTWAAEGPGGADGPAEGRDQRSTPEDLRYLCRAGRLEREWSVRPDDRGSDGARPWR